MREKKKRGLFFFPRQIKFFLLVEEEFNLPTNEFTLQLPAVISTFLSPKDCPAKERTVYSHHIPSRAQRPTAFLNYLHSGFRGSLSFK